MEPTRRQRMIEIVTSLWFRRGLIVVQAVCLLGAMISNIVKGGSFFGYLSLIICGLGFGFSIQMYLSTRRGDGELARIQREIDEWKAQPSPFVLPKQFGQLVTDEPDDGEDEFEIYAEARADEEMARFLHSLVKETDDDDATRQ